jgi:hypothetical protein
MHEDTPAVRRFWDLNMKSPLRYRVDLYQQFWGTYYLHIQGRRWKQYVSETLVPPRHNIAIHKLEAKKKQNYNRKFTYLVKNKHK